MKHWGVWVVIILVVGIGAAWLFSRAGLLGTEQPVVINGIAAPPLPQLKPASVARGKGLYSQHCAACHGANLEGKPDWKIPLADGSLPPPPPPHDSTGHTWHHPDELLMDIVTNGGDPKYHSQMPAFKDQLTKEQIVDVLDFIKSTWGKEERNYQWWMTAVGSQQ